jgi:hypothetical protein
MKKYKVVSWKDYHGVETFFRVVVGPLASSAHSRRQRSQQVQRLPALLGQALAGLDSRSLQRGQ